MEDEDINKIFTAKASSIEKLFFNNGFRIPSYQRPFDWKADNISRLFDDVLSGFMGLNLKKNPGSLTFLGTILLVRGNSNNTEPDFDDTSLLVVDGQQRLTTLSLVIGILLQEMDMQRGCLANQSVISGDARDWLQKELEGTRHKLFTCIVGKQSSELHNEDVSNYKFYPRIVREMDDIRASDANHAEYVSLISNFLFRLAISSKNKQQFDFEVDFKVPVRVPDGEKVHFSNSIKSIQQLVDKFFGDKPEQINSEDVPKIPSMQDLLGRRNYRNLFSKLNQNMDIHDQISSSILKAKVPKINRLLRVLAFSNYLINQVVLTRVEVTEEKYAFDIFESLNTTGEPLTAIETFKPKVIEYVEGKMPGYKRSDEYDYFEELEKYLAKFKKDDKKQAVSSELVISFGLYATGETLSNKLSEQRAYLRTRYSELGDCLSKRKRFVKGLCDISKYKRDCWDSDGLAEQFIREEGAEELLFCLNFISQMKTKMSIPILTRYYIDYKETGHIEQFKKAIRAVTAFLSLRRSATGQTQGIDTDFRNLMKRGLDDSLPLMLGDSMANTLPTIDQLQSHLRGYLAANRLSINNKKTWVNSLVAQPLYKSSVPLCKFLLMICATDGGLDETRPGLIKSSRPNPQNNFMKLSAWKDRAFQSVEHIAPDSRPSDFENAIYDSQITRNLIGNLTLLPKSENSSVGNKPWRQKKLYFSAFSAKDQSELNEIFLRADSQGLSFGKNLKDHLEIGPCLPVVASISQVDEWTKDIIEARSTNIAERVWDKISPWLGY